MSRVLKAAGVPIVGGERGQTQTKLGLKRLFAIKRPAYWRRQVPLKVAEHYNGHFAGNSDAGAKY